MICLLLLKNCGVSMSKSKVYFYQNNPCVIVRVINDDFAEIQLSHHFAESMELRGQCLGCCVGDSDNKLSCTCDEFSWVIEEVQNEENKVLCIVERRLLADHPIEKTAIDKLQKQISDEKQKLEIIKITQQEWSEDLKVKRNEFSALEAKCAALRLENESLLSAGNAIAARFDGVKEKYNAMTVFIDKNFSKGIQISNGEYQKLIKRDAVLTALENGGVDNWEWYGESVKHLVETE